MKVKASLHLHSQEDIEDNFLMTYTLYDLIDAAAKLDFKVVASTCHARNIAKPEHFDYARRRGLLLLTGVELNLDGRRHVLVLNCGSAADGLGSFKELREFKDKHPEAFIIAPHPNHYKSSLTLKWLEKNLDLFDAAEHSWFYTRSVNPNKRTRRFCLKHRLPFIATADAHTLDYLNIDYAVIDIPELTAAAVFKSIKEKRFKNHSRPKSFGELAAFYGRMIFYKLINLLKLK